MKYLIGTESGKSEKQPDTIVAVIDAQNEVEAQEYVRGLASAGFVVSEERVHVFRLCSVVRPRPSVELIEEEIDDPIDEPNDEAEIAEDGPAKEFEGSGDPSRPDMLGLFEWACKVGGRITKKSLAKYTYIRVVGHQVGKKTVIGKFYYLAGDDAGSIFTIGEDTGWIKYEGEIHPEDTAPLYPDVTAHCAIAGGDE